MSEEPNKEGAGGQTDIPSRSVMERIIFRNQRELRSGWRFGIYLFLTILIVLLLGIIAVVLRLPLPPEHMDALALLTQEVIFAVAAFGAAAVMARFEERPFGVYGLPGRGAFRRHFWQGTLWGFAMISAMILLIRAFGGFSFGRFALGGGATLRYAALWGVVFLTVGFFEEFFFRGYTQFTLATGIGFWPAAIVSSGLFGMAHLMNPGEAPVGALSVFVIGMFFCLTLERTGSLWFAVGLHAAFDWGETFFYAVPNSGAVAPGHLFDSSLHGARWLTGGSVGPEGSAMAFAVMAAAFVIFHFCYRRPSGPAAIEAPRRNWIHPGAARWLLRRPHR
ncbi:MAG TPA: CPBP family intramembrane glutamic endopeptidase [Candidatus Dormibacteraeota bacterium]|nr:CPBP family intramembrane glutamic endopeptidase [Candidatus Dormibacteraeota bacterium]